MARPAFLVFVSVRTLAAATALLAVSAVLVSCGDAEEEAGPDVQSPAVTSVGQSPSPVTTPLATSTPAVPAGWTEYSNKKLGFSLHLPARLVPRDLSSTAGSNPQWVIDFRDPADASYGVSVVIVENREVLSLADWARMNVCDPAGPEKGGQPIDIDGTVGLFCWMEVMDDASDRHVVFEAGLRIFDLQSTEKVADADFERVVQSFMLTSQETQ